eukprot:591346-Prymnesium_polylepis.1
MTRSRPRVTGGEGCMRAHARALALRCAKASRPAPCCAGGRAGDRRMPECLAARWDACTCLHIRAALGRSATLAPTVAPTIEAPTTPRRGV